MQFEPDLTMQMTDKYRIDENAIIGVNERTLEEKNHGWALFLFFC